MANETLIPSPVGILKLVETDGIISGIHFTEQQEVAIFDTFINDVLKNCAIQLAEYFDGKRMDFTFPMQQVGTVFQQRVWQQLTTIPFGKTISYNRLAIQLGDAKCIRAAGTANGRNNIAIVVPCHRVIGSNGSLVGYAGGIWRKQWLLEHEARWAHGVQQLF